MPEPVSVVWCDVGGVLTSSVGDAAQRLAYAAGLSWPELWGAINEVALRSGLTGLGPLETGIVSQAEWGTRVMERLPRPSAIDLRRWDEHWYAARSPNPELLTRLAAWRSRGVRVGLLTNSVAEWEPHRARLFDDRNFDAALRSHELGVRKPDPQMYAAAERALPAPAAATVLIDDTEANCVAARARGWRAVHHVGTATTVTALEGAIGGS